MSRPWLVPIVWLPAAACSFQPAKALDDAAPPPADSADAAPVDGAACGARAGSRGKTVRTVNPEGVERSYIVYLPQAADPRAPMPLVFVHHGYTMSAESMFDITGYPELAEAEGIALAFPDGQSGPNSPGAPWNVGADVCPATTGAPPIATGDDFALLDAIEADIAQDQCIDTSHVYVTGFSMGGYFSHHAGCMRDDIRAIAPHSGGTHALDTCVTTRKPVIMFHGSADALIPPGCEDPDALSLPGVTPAAAAWAARNGCASTRTTVDVDGGSCDYYDGCPAGGQVAICRFTLMGHCWAGGPLGSIYACPPYASATSLAWAFFKQYAW